MSFLDNSGERRAHSDIALDAAAVAINRLASVSSRSSSVDKRILPMVVGRGSKAAEVHTNSVSPTRAGHEGGPFAASLIACGQSDFSASVIIGA